MKSVLLILGVVIAWFAAIEFLNTLKSVMARKWKSTDGTLIQWDMRNDQDSEDTRLVIDQFKYKYTVGKTEYKSERIGFGFPNGMSVLYVGGTMDKILNNAPSLRVYFNPSAPKISTLCVGIKLFHIIKNLAYALIFMVIVVAYYET